MRPPLSFATHILRCAILVMLPPAYAVVTAWFPPGVRYSYRRWVSEHPPVVALAFLWWLAALAIDAATGAGPDGIVLDLVCLAIVAALAVLYPGSKVDEPGPGQGAP